MSRRACRLGVLSLFDGSRPAGIALVLAAVGVLSAQGSRAQSLTDLWWDPNGIAPGLGGAGTWSAGSGLWANNSGGVASVLGGLLWPSAGEAHRANLNGTPGPLTLTGPVTAGAVNFGVGGYQLNSGVAVQGGVGRLIVGGANGTYAGRITVATNTTTSSAAFIQGTFAAGQTVDSGQITLDGGGTLALLAENLVQGVVTVSGTSTALRLDHGSAMAKASLRLAAGGWLSLGAGVGSASVLAMDLVSSGNERPVYELGSSQLNLTGGSAFTSTSTFAGSVTGTASGVLTVGQSSGSAHSLILTQAAGVGTGRTASSFGSLQIYRGASRISGAVDVSLTSPGLTGSSGNSSLLIDGTSSLTVDSGAMLTLHNRPVLRNGGTLAVTGGASVRLANSGLTTLVNPELIVGAAGSGSGLTVSGTGSTLTVDLKHPTGNFDTGLLTIGSIDGGRGAAVVSSGGTITAHWLRFGSAQSSFTVGELGTANVRVLIPGEAGTITVRSAGTLNVTGDEVHIVTGPISGSGDSGGTINIQAGTFAPLVNSSYSGVYRMFSGTRFTPGSFGAVNATVQLDSGSVLDASRVAANAVLAVGGLTGSGAVQVGATRFEFRQNSDERTFAGVFTSTGEVVKFSSAAQNLTGGTLQSPSTAGSLRVYGGLLTVAEGGVLRLSPDTLATSLEVGADGPTRLLVRAGGRLEVGATGVAVYAGGTLDMNGSGSVVVAAGAPVRVVTEARFIGPAGPSALIVRNNSRLEAGSLQLGTAGPSGTLSPVASAVVSSGGTVSLTGSLVVNPSGSLLVTGATLHTPEISGGGAVAFSDLSTEVPALRLGFITPGVGGARTISSDLRDGTSGPGSVLVRNVSASPGYTATFTGSLAFTGSVVADQGGTAVLPNAFSAGRVVARNGGSVLLGSAGGTLAATGKTLLAQAGGTLTYGNTSSPFTVVGGMLSGPGQMVRPSARITLSGVTLAGDAALALGAASTTRFVGVSTAGGIDLFVGATLTFGGGLTVRPGAQLSLAPLSLVTSDTGGSLTLDSARLVNAGAVGTPLVVGAGSVAGGTGTFARVTVNSGGTFAPGNSPGIVTTGSVTWNPGGRYQIEIADAAGPVGIGFDHWTVLGTLDLLAANTPESRFVLELDSLSRLASDTPAFAPGPAEGFDPTRPYAWQVLTTTGGVIGFDTSRIALDTSGFSNPTLGGTFGTSVRGDALFVTFTPVPEPGVLTLLLPGVAILARARRAR